MATKPTNNPVKALDLRSINNALNMLGDQVFAAQSTAEYARAQAGENAFRAGQGTTSVAQIQQQLAQLASQISVLAAGSLSPLTTYRADAAFTAFDVAVPTSDGGVSPVDTQDPTAIFAAVGVATSNAAAGGNVVVRRSGTLAGAGIGWEAGRAVYAQVGNGLTQIPSYAAVALPVGVAINSTDLDVRTAWPSLLEPPLYGGGYEDFMPVTLRLVRAALQLVDSLVDQPDGFVVKVGDVMTTRALIAGSAAGIVIDNPDGVLGDPSFRLG